MRTINTIKAALVKLLDDHKATLGIKSLKADISPQDMVQAVEKELPEFPGCLVIFAQETVWREGAGPGSSLVADLVFSIFLADRRMTGPYASGATAIDLIEDLRDLVDGQRPSKLQKTPFEYGGAELNHQDVTLVIYQVQFRTQVVHGRR